MGDCRRFASRATCCVVPCAARWHGPWAATAVRPRPPFNTRSASSCARSSPELLQSASLPIGPAGHERGIQRHDTLRLVDDSRQETAAAPADVWPPLARAIWRLSPAGCRRRISADAADVSDAVLSTLKALHPHVLSRVGADQLPRHARRVCRAGPAGAVVSGSVRPTTRSADSSRRTCAGPCLTSAVGPMPFRRTSQDYPPELLYGIDPLEPFEPHPFTFARGLGRIAAVSRPRLRRRGGRHVARSLRSPSTSRWRRPRA